MQFQHMEVKNLVIIAPVIKTVRVIRATVEVPPLALTVIAYV